MKKIILTIFAISIFAISNAQNGNVGIGTNNPLQKLHIDGSAVGLQTIRIDDLKNAGPGFNPSIATLPIVRRATLIVDTLTGDMYSVPESQSYWGLYGNAGTSGLSVSGSCIGVQNGNMSASGYDYVGTRDAKDLIFATNDKERGRMLSDGQFVYYGKGTTVPTTSPTACIPAYPSIDLASFYTTGTTYAINAYTENAPGLYASSTNSPGIQADAAPALTTTFGNSIAGFLDCKADGGATNKFDLNYCNYVYYAEPDEAVGTSIADYTFGIYSQVSNMSTSSYPVGGVLGILGYTGGTALSISNGGCLGYRNTAGTNFSVYGFGTGYTTGTTGGRIGDLQKDNNVGIGITGGFMGGYVMGNKIGLHVSGEQYGMFVDGNTISNKPFVQLNDNGNNTRVATYGSTALTEDINTKGIGIVNKGTATIPFPENFKNLVSDDIIVTVTPIGPSKGLYLVAIDKNGFTIKENNNGMSDNLKFTWIAMATKKTNETNTIANEILNPSYESNMKEVANSEQSDSPKSIWWNGENISFDPIERGSFETEGMSNPIKNKKKYLTKPNNPSKE
jgi:hypothetical protein